jgi:hypothetical protein
MHRRSTRLGTCAGLVVAVAAPSTASAVIVANWQPNTISPAAIADNPALASMQSWSLMVTHGDGDWGSAGVELTLPAGNAFFQHSFGGNTRPNPALTTVFPSLAYDTYVSSPGDTGSAGAPFILGPFPPAAGSGQLGPQRLSVIWGDFVATPPGTYEILRVTFPNSAFPAGNQLNFTAQTNPAASGPAAVNLGQSVPYPIKSWLPDADGEWNVADNWSDASLPTMRQRVLLDVGGATVRTITHAAGNTELHELRTFERIVLSGGTLATYVTEVNGELLVSGGTFRPQGLNHLSGSGAVTVATGGAVVAGDSSALVVGPGATLRGTGGAMHGSVFNNGGRILAPSAGDTLGGTTGLQLLGGETGGDGAVRVAQLHVFGNSAKVGNGVLRASGTFTVHGSNTLDVRAGALVHDYSGPSPLADVRAKIVSGYANNTWTGTGIRSSAAAADDNLALGYAEASALFATFPATFMGESIDPTTLLVRLVRNGDANLDGTVNLDDFNRLASSFGSGNALWDDGDFNYDALVNLTDFNLLAANFGLGAAGPTVTPNDWFALTAAVPEPVGATLAVVALSAVVARRRRC